MTAAVRETSIQAHAELRATGKLATMQQGIITALSHGRDYSLREISRLTSLEINTVSGRVNELKKLGLLIEGEKRHCSITGKTITPVKKAVQ